MLTPKQILLRGLVMWILSMVLVSFFTPSAKQYPEISYFDFKNQMQNKEIVEVQYSSEDNFAIVKTTNDSAEYKLNIISKENFETDIYEYSLAQESFIYSKYQKPQSLDGFTSFLILIVFNIIGYYLWNKAYRLYLKKKFNTQESKYKKEDDVNKLFSGSFDFLGSDFKPRVVDSTEISFKDVIGLDKQMDELQDIVRFLKMPEKYEEIGAALPKGILLFGQPGVGKTHIARAIAGEANVKFYEISASEFNAKYLGESEERIRLIFKSAEENAPAIIYIDEIDSIAVKRYSDNSNKYSASILNQLLACMDGFNKDTNVIVIAATNHVDTLDEAILRSGRFDRKIFIHTPDKDARSKLFEYYSADKVIDEHVDMDRIIDITTGLTGADIKTILNEAAILSVRKGEPSISEESIMEAFRKIEIGTENNFTRNSKEQLLKTAIHESGHAIVSKCFGQKVSEISIISRGSAAGYNLATPEENANYDFDELKHKVMILLAGRAAEEEICSERSAGASDDLKRASSIIRDMFLKFSMSKKDNVSLVLTDDGNLNEVVIKNAFTDMNDFFKKCYDETKAIIRLNKDILLNLTNQLLEKETLSKNEIEVIIQEVKES